MESHVTLCEMGASGTDAYWTRLTRQWRRFTDIRDLLLESMSDEFAEEYAQRLIGLIDHPGR